MVLAVWSGNKLCLVMLLLLAMHIKGSLQLRAFLQHRSRYVSPFFNSCLKLRSNTYLSMAKKLDIRPSIDDIERISRGQAAKRRGTGSRQVPHRLNEMERREWDLAKIRRYLLLRGTGWRKERGDSPLANIYRNYCDAVAVPCVTVSRGVTVPKLNRSDSLGSSDASGFGSELVDEVSVDFSPLRTVAVRELATQIAEWARHYDSVINVADGSDVAQLGWAEDQMRLETEVIWRLPAFSISVTFRSREDSKRFAEQVAFAYCGGTIASEQNKASKLNQLHFDESEEIDDL